MLTSVAKALWTRVPPPDMLPGVMDVEGYATTSSACSAARVRPSARPTRSRWTGRVATGYRVVIDRERCTDCGICLDACPGPGLDFRQGAWWRERNAGAAGRDFLGPWRRLWFGWAADPEVRHAGASGGLATALLTGLLEEGLADAVLAVGMSDEEPLQAVGVVCRSPAEVAACRGSKYDVVAVNALLRTVLDEPRTLPSRRAAMPCPGIEARAAPLPPAA